MGMADWFGGGGYGGLGGGMPYNAMAGLGMGLMSGTIGNPYGAAMAGFAQGSQADAQNAYRMALLKDRAQDNAFKERQLAEQQRQFNEVRYAPVSIETTEDDDGNVKYILKNPKAGTAQQISPQQAQSLSGRVSMTAPAQQTANGAEDESTMPPNARLAQAGGPPTVSPSVNYVGNKKYREEAYKKQADTDVQARERTDRGGALLGIVDSIDQKIQSPEFKAVSQANPIAGAASGGDPLYNPARWAYEMVGSRENKAMMDRIKQDAQALQLEFGNLFYKGQGAVSDRERDAIRDLVGKIQEARSPEDAKALTQNLRLIIKGAIQKVPGYNVPTGGGGSGGWTVERVP